MTHIDYSKIEGLRFTSEFFDFANKYSKKYRKIRRKTVNEMKEYKESMEGGLNSEQDSLTINKQFIKENEYSARVFDKYILFNVNLPVDRWLEINGDVIFNNGNVYKKCKIAAKTIQELLDRFKLSTTDIEVIDTEVIIL